jgi:hypothetical protein
MGIFIKIFLKNEFKIFFLILHVLSKDKNFNDKKKFIIEKGF